MDNSSSLSFKKILFNKDNRQFLSVV
jgi:hypothetical protein